LGAGRVLAHLRTQGRPVAAADRIFVGGQSAIEVLASLIAHRVSRLASG